MSTPGPTKNVRAFSPSRMTLDMRGRLVANKEAVFMSGGIQNEINAAKKLGEALAIVRAKKKASIPDPDK
jgi:hypothetical protein